MDKAKDTWAWMPDGDTPECPHCGGDVSSASVMLGDIAASLSGMDSSVPWHFEGRVSVHSDGYAVSTNEHQFLRVECPQCSKPSLFGTSGARAFLHPMRTAKDEKIIATQHRRNKMKFEIKKRWTNEVAFVAEIDATSAKE